MWGADRRGAAEGGSGRTSCGWAALCPNAFGSWLSSLCHSSPASMVMSGKERWPSGAAWTPCTQHGHQKGERQVDPAQVLHFGISVPADRQMRGQQRGWGCRLQFNSDTDGASRVASAQRPRDQLLLWMLNLTVYTRSQSHPLGSPFTRITNASQTGIPASFSFSYLRETHR